MIAERDLHPARERELIMLVEDSPAQALQTQLILEQAGYAVRVCGSGAMALAFVAEEWPDLILLDMHLPDLSGQEIAQRFKRDPLLSGIPIIFLTGVFREVKDIIRGLEQGADDYIDKAVDTEELIARVRATLRSKKTQRELGRLARLLLTVNQVSRQLAGLLDLETLITSVVRLIHENFDYPHVHLFLIQGDELILRAGAGQGAQELVAKRPRLGLDGNSMAAESFKRGCPVLVTKDESERFTHPLLAQVCSGAAAPLRSAGRVSGVLEIVSPTARAFSANDGLVLETLADMVGMALHNSRMYEEMEELATLDGLTGLLNRRTILRRLDDEYERSRRYHRQLALVSVDIDHFKQVNDTYGHACGDRAIQAVAEMLRHVIRSVDLIGRFGGDEFLLVLPETDPRGALDVAERLRVACERLVIKSDEGNQIPFTLSLGVVSGDSTMIASPAEILRATDQALYRAKLGGRNRVST